MVLPREPIHFEKVLTSYILGRQIVFVGELGTVLRLPTPTGPPMPVPAAEANETSCGCCESRSAS